MTTHRRHQDTLLSAGWLLGGFGVNAAWELAQWPLYTHFEGFTGHHVLGCLRAALSDVGILLVLYVVIALVSRDARWARSPRPWQLLMLAALGAAIAVAVELCSVAANRWGYKPAMPLIPGTGVGWVPVLQMMVLPVILAIAAARIARVDLDTEAHPRIAKKPLS